LIIKGIFKGTNYQDRIYGAVNVVKKLNDDKTILFITTHDFELCDIKINNLKNYNVREYYEDDFIKFDYKIREGKCESTNAKYLMKKLNIIDK
jgi:DNA mismatch repair ATPase MutS